MSRLEMLADKLFGGGGGGSLSAYSYFPAAAGKFFGIPGIIFRIFVKDMFCCRGSSYEILKLLQRVQSRSDIRELEEIFWQ